MFHSFHGLMNSINWPASSIWVFIAQLREHCSANAEATGSNPVEAPKNFFSGHFRNCLNCDSLRWSHTHFICISAVHIISFRVYDVCGSLTAWAEISPKVSKGIRWLRLIVTYPVNKVILFLNNWGQIYTSLYTLIV